MNIEYNSGLEDIVLREYGRNIQKIAKYVAGLPDPEERKKKVFAMVELMKMINPLVKDNADYHARLWNHLYIITDFKLAIDNPPFPPPSPESISKKPDNVPYSSIDFRYKHYGRNIELLIKKVMKIEDPEEREASTIYLGKTMKRFFESWNKDSVADEIIVQQIKELSKGALTVDIEKVKAGNLFYSYVKENVQGGNSSSSSSNQKSSSSKPSSSGKKGFSAPQQKRKRK